LLAVAGVQTCALPIYKDICGGIFFAWHFQALQA